MATELYKFTPGPAFLALSPRHQVFVAALCGDKEHNQTKAAIKAGFTPNSARQRACEIVKKSNVQAAIQEIQANLTAPDIADAAEVRRFLTSVMRGDITRFVRWSRDQGFAFTEDSDDIPEELRRLIKRVKVKEKASAQGDWTETETQVELHDPIRAAEALAKDLGIFKEDKASGGMSVEIVRFTEVQGAEGASGEPVREREVEVVRFTAGRKGPKDDEK